MNECTCDAAIASSEALKAQLPEHLQLWPKVNRTFDAVCVKDDTDYWE